MSHKTFITNKHRFLSLRLRTRHYRHLRNSNRLNNKMVRIIQTKMPLLVHQLTVILALVFPILKQLQLRNLLILRVNLEVGPYKRNQAFHRCQMIHPNPNPLILEMQRWGALHLSLLVKQNQAYLH